MIAYKDFVKNKLKFNDCVGFKHNEVNPMLFDFQKHITMRAVEHGRFAIYADCGLGKTPMQLDWARIVHEKENANVLIVAPLSVSKQTKREGEKFGVEVTICRKQDDVKKGINITNYEMLQHFNPDEFCGIVLDESSILKSHTAKYRNMIIDMFERTRYKLSCTATPAPNDFVEIGNQCEFLGVMSRSEMLSTFFINDTANTGTWRLKGHSEEKFYEWLCSWSIMIKKPSDLGFSDDKFILPELHIDELIVDNDSVPLEGMLFALGANTLSERRSARKSSMEERVRIAAEICNDSEKQFIVWCDLNDESRMLKDSINGAVEVKGSDSNEHKENAIVDFQLGKIRVIVSKPKIYGFGINLQNCNNMVFVGLSDSYESFYQAIRRCWRFGQKKEVYAKIITSKLEGAVLNNIKRKERDAETMSAEMSKRMSVYSRKEISEIIDSEYSEKSESGEFWKLYNGDSVEIIKTLKTDSIHYSIYSPPFASLFTYSNSDRDMGNCKGMDDFLVHFKYLAGELYRVTMQGRLMSFHVMNIPATITQDGFIGIKDLRGELIRLFQDVGFIFHSEVCIWKDPLVQATRTKTLTLAHKQISKDASRCSQGYPDYIITMRKKGDNPEPVAKGRGFEKYVGEMPNPENAKTNDPRTNKYSHNVWQRYASPVWFDIRQTRTLNARQAKDKRDERHMCPLQLDTIERCIELWTNEGDIVFSPFAGIGSEGYGAILQNRRFIGVELKESYFVEAVRNLKKASAEKNEGLLF